MQAIDEREIDRGAGGLSSWEDSMRGVFMKLNDMLCACPLQVPKSRGGAAARVSFLPWVDDDVMTEPVICKCLGNPKRRQPKCQADFDADGRSLAAHQVVKLATLSLWHPVLPGRTLVD
jgi:hypothetical protein